MIIHIQKIFIITFLLLTASAQGANYSDVYNTHTLQKAKNTYAKNLRSIWEEDLLTRLTARERLAAGDIRLELPLIGHHKHPFDYYADPFRRKVSIPIVSVKFLDDIAISQAWLERHGCNTLAISDYTGMLRYQGINKMARGRFPAPMQAMNIPANALDDFYVNDVSGKTLKSAIYFLMAHELGHVIHGHKGYKSLTSKQAQQQEIQADAFALNVMRRISVPPMGMATFFLIASRFELVPGDFGNNAKYEAYLQTQATHPLTSNRLLAISNNIRTNINSFARLQKNPSAFKPRILSIANNIEGISRILSDPKIRELQRYRSQRVTLSDLKNSCRK